MEKDHQNKNNSSSSKRKSLIEEMEEKYEKLEKLGEGTYGIVYKARDKTNNSFVAIKKIRLENASEGIPSTAMREIVVLKELNHPGIVDLKEVIYIPKEKILNLVFEYLDFDMKKFMKGHSKSLSEAQIKSFVRQLLEATDHCHSRRIIHRDIKPQNLLIDKDHQTLKLADFGLARVFTIPIRTLTHEIETLWYRAPEILLGTKQYSLGVDNWAIGCVLAEFYLKKPLFMGTSEIDQIFKIFEFHGTPNEDDWPGVNELQYFQKGFPKFKGNQKEKYLKGINNPMAIDLILKLINIDPGKRIAASEALDHAYFKN